MGKTCILDPPKIESYFSDRFTFSNIRGRTSRRIYRLALPLLSPETLSSMTKLMIFLFKGTVSLDNQPRCPRITIGSCGEVVVNYLIFAGIL